MIEMFGEVTRVVSMSLVRRDAEFRLPVFQDTKILRRLVKAARTRTPVNVAICWPIPSSYTPGYMGGPKLADPILYSGCCTVKSLVISCAAGERVEILLSLRNRSHGKNPWKSSGSPMKGERLRKFNLQKSVMYRIMNYCDADVKVSQRSMGEPCDPWGGCVINEFELRYERGRGKANISVLPVRTSPLGKTIGDGFTATITLGRSFSDTVPASVNLSAGAPMPAPRCLNPHSKPVDLQGRRLHLSQGHRHMAPQARWTATRRNLREGP